MVQNQVKKDLKAIFCHMSDFAFRDLTLGKTKLTACYLSSFISKEAMTCYILEPLTRAFSKGIPVLSVEDCLTGVGVNPISTVEEAVLRILNGEVFLFGNAFSHMAGVSVICKNETGRSAVEPETENVIRGPHEGFTESLDNNVMLLRRRLKTVKLKRETFTVGHISKTEISVLYLNGIADPHVVEKVKKRVGGIETDLISDSGTVEIFIEDGKNPLYPTVGNSERPDKVAAKLAEGRVAVIVDGSPVVLTVPFLFIEAFQVVEDYAKSSLYATFIRTLRFLSYLICLYFPALFVAVFIRHRELLPQNMIQSLTEARERIRFSLFWEVLAVFLIFEAIREVGLRMPKAVGSAVGLVGPLILGESAIKAGFASAPVLVVVALAAVCNFIVPPYMNGNVLYRLFMIVLSGALGFFGFMTGLTLTVFLLASKTSFGVPYLSPLAPLDGAGLHDFLYMAPISKKRRLPAALCGKTILRGKDDDR